MNIAKDSVLGFSIIDNRLKIFVKQGSVSQLQNNNQSQESSNQEGNTPDITKAEGEVKYYNYLDYGNIFNSDKTESADDDWSFFQGWKQGDKYYLKANVSNKYVTVIIEDRDTFKPFFDFPNNPSATKIKNIKPAIFNATTGQLIERGKLEVS